MWAFTGTRSDGQILNPILLPNLKSFNKFGQISNLKAPFSSNVKSSSDKSQITSQIFNFRFKLDFADWFFATSKTTMRLFREILYNKTHVLHTFLPDRPEIVYHLRSRKHSKSLIDKTTWMIVISYSEHFTKIVIDFNFNCMHMPSLHLPWTFLAYCLLCIMLVAFDNFCSRIWWWWWWWWTWYSDYCSTVSQSLRTELHAK